jgi:hypothetical protein
MMNQIAILKSLYIRDLDRLHEEITKYTTEDNMWRPLPGTSNCGGNLALHLVGNLNTFICGQIGNSGYVRDRVAEFNRKDVPQAELLEMIADTKTGVLLALENLPEEKLAEDYTLRVFPETMTLGWFLFHLATHLTYHLGQTNYHRRIVEANGK